MFNINLSLPLTMWYLSYDYAVFYFSQYLRVWISKRGMSMCLGEQQWQLLVMWVDLETPSMVCFDEFLIVYY